MAKEHIPGYLCYLDPDDHAFVSMCIAKVSTAKDNDQTKWHLRYQVNGTFRIQSCFHCSGPFVSLWIVARPMSHYHLQNPVESFRDPTVNTWIKPCASHSPYSVSETVVLQGSFKSKSWGTKQVLSIQERQGYVKDTTEACRRKYYPKLQETWDRLNNFSSRESLRGFWNSAAQQQHAVYNQCTLASNLSPFHSIGALRWARSHPHRLSTVGFSNVCPLWATPS